MNNGFPLPRMGAPRGASARGFEKAADRLVLLSLLAAVCVFILYPAGCVLLRGLQSEAGTPSLEQYARVWTDYRQSLLNSVFTGAATALLSTALAAAVALVAATRRGKARLFCMGMLFVTMVSPPFVASLAYILLYGRRGWIAWRLLHISWNPYNGWGVIGMQSLSFLPLNALMLVGVLARIDQNSVRAARDLGAGGAAVLRDVVLPQMRPGLASALLLTFVRSLADFATPVIIGGRFSTLASEIYLQFVGYSDLEKASAMNLFLLVPSVAALLLYRRLMNKQTDPGGRARQRTLEIRLSRCGVLGGFILFFCGLTLALLGLQYGCVFLSGFLKHTKTGVFFTGEYLQRLWRYDGVTMLRSVGYGLCVAVTGTLLGMLFAYYINRRKVIGRGLWDCAAMLPSMLPGTCFGIGYILAFNHPPLRLTGSALLVLCNMLFRQLPATSKICAATLNQIPAAQENAARDLGAGRLAVLRDVIAPGMRPALVNAFIYNFSSAMTTAGAILFLIDPGRKLAVFKLFDAVYTGEYGLASAIATVMILIVLLVDGVVWLATGKAGRADDS